MTQRSEAEIWTRLEHRLSGVEASIPQAPHWEPSITAPLRGNVRLRPSARSSSLGQPRRSPLVVVFATVVLLLMLLAGALLAGGFLTDPSRDDERFGPWGALRQAEGDARAALLPDGRTIIVAGEWQGMGSPRARAELWDPVTGLSSIDPPTTPRVDPTTTLLLDGRVLVVGGFGGGLYAYPSSTIPSAEIWDPTASTFLPTGSMTHARVRHTATLLPDGRVLVIGGIGPEGAVVEAELWDPRTETFAAAGRLAHARTGHEALLLLDGRVIVAGGIDPIAGLSVAEVELWDPSSRSFTTVLSLDDAPTSLALTRLPSGSVLMSGAFAPPDSPGSFRGALIWDPDGGGEQRPEMAAAREGHTSTLLTDGRVMVAGGWGPTGDELDSVELWDPADGRFHPATPLSQAVANHTAVLLADGHVLIVPDGSGADGVVEPFIYRPGAKE